MKKCSLAWQRSLMIVLFLFVLQNICWSSGNIAIRSVKRLPKGKYIMNEHEELIGARYNQKFYVDEEEEKGVIFVIKIENKELQPYSVHLFYKTAKSKNLQTKVIEVSSPSKAKETIRIGMPLVELKEKGHPDFWWIEVRDIAGVEVLDEKGMKNFKKIKQRLQLIEQSE